MTSWPQSLRARVLSVVLVTTFIALAVATAALAIYDARVFRASVITDLTTQAEILGRTNAPALAFDDPKTARENLALMHARRSVLAAALYKPSGELFASYNRDDASGSGVPAAPGPAGIRIEGGEIWLVQPVMEQGEAAGVVLLRARYDLWERMVSYVVTLLAVMAASLCVALLVTAFLQSRITTPLLRMSDVARKVIEQRDFSLRVARTETREVDVLVDAFNAMLAEVGRQTEALGASNRSLHNEMEVRRNAEDALRLADRNKDRFLATLAHELRNPLAPLFNGVALLRMAPGAATGPKQILDMMDRQLRQMVRLIDDLLDVSRIATDKLVLRNAPLDLAAAVRSAIETAAPLIQDRRHALEVVLPAGPMPMTGDSTRLAQVFANLLNNAAKFTPEGGHIRVEAVQDQTGITASVADDGIGVDAGMLSQMFELFAQGDQTLERPLAGLGVGLTLARRLVEMHGGTLEACSEGRGRGSRFVVRLPHAAVPLHQPTLAPGDADRASASGHRILIVDDNRDFANSLATILSSLGNEVRVAYDGAEGLAEARTFLPEVAFLDIGMPKLNGYDLARQLRALPQVAHSLLVAVTGWGQESDRAQARDAGFDQHLTKPVDPGELVAILRKRESAPAASLRRS